MFHLEKEMIPVLKRDLPSIFGAVHSAEEFVSGNGRPDLVFARVSDAQMSVRSALPDYQTLHLLVKYLNREGRTLHVNEVLTQVTNRKSIQTIIDLLSQSGFIECANDGYFTVRRKYRPITEEFVSIEAKLSDWKSGVYQAMRYRAFSNSAYLAISEDYLDRVDRAFLRSNGIGLISVGSEGACLIIKARNKKPTSLISHYYLSERLVSLLTTERSELIHSQ